MDGKVLDIGTLDAQITAPVRPVKLPEGAVGRYLKRHHLRRSKANVLRARAFLRKRRDAAAAKIGKEISGSESAEPHQVIYGTMRVGGVYSFIHTINNNQNLLLVVTIAGHEITAVNKVFFDGEEVVFGSGFPGSATSPAKYAGKVYAQVNLGSTGQSALSQLITDAPTYWTSNHKQSNRAHVYLKLSWDGNAFPNGLPDIVFEVQGKKVYDPRSGLTQFSANPALCIADYLTDSSFGLGYSTSDIDTTALTAAADICDQSVSIITGGTESRYTLNGSFNTDETPGNILGQMLTAMAGDLVLPVAGKAYLYAGAYRSPSITLTEDDIISDIQVQTRISKRDSFNAVKGTYTSPQNSWEESDFPAIRNSFYLAEDNGEVVFEDISLPFTTSAATAQRIAKITLEQIRQSIIVDFAAKLKAYQAMPGETVSLTISRFGWTSKVFEVQQSQLVIDDDGEGSPSAYVLLNLRETASTVYDWAAGEETRVDSAPNTSLPSPFSVETISGLTLTSGTSELYVRADGTVFSRIKAAWSALTDFFVTSGGYVEVQYKQSVASEWENATPIPGDNTFTHILDVQDGVQYDVRVRARSATGVTGSYTTAAGHVVVGKTAPPSNVLGLSAHISGYGIVISWNDIADLDIDKYEIRVGASWATALVITQIKGTTYTWDIQIAGTYNILIKALDTSGNYSTTESAVTATISGPVAPIVAFSIVQSSAVLTWNEPAAEFSVAYYAISYGDTYGASVAIGTALTTTFQYQATWNGLRRFWVAAVDVAGNVGTPGSVDINVLFPGSVTSPSGDVIDNSVTLRWTEPAIAGTLPVAFYQVYKGDIFATSELVGQTAATFTVVLESTGGDYTYWVTAIDTAGNEGAQSPLGLMVNQPPDFILRDNQILDPELAETKTNILIGRAHSIFLSFDPVTDPEITGCVLDLDSETNITLDGSTSYRVNSWQDRSSHALTFSQATAGLKPRQTRTDNSENRCLWSQDLTQVWATSGASISANGTANPITGANTADKIVENGALSTHYVYQSITDFKYLKRYRFIGDYLAAGRDRIEITLTTNFAANSHVGVDLNAGTLLYTGSGASNASIQALGSGWFRVSFEAIGSASGPSDYKISLLDSGSLATYTGNGTSGVYATNLIAQVAAANSTYVYTTDGREYRGYNGHRGIFFEDDNAYELSVATPTHLKFDTGDFTIFAAVALHDAADGTTNFEIISNETANANGWLLRLNGSSTYDSHFRTNQAGTNTSLSNTNDCAVDAASVLAIRKNGTNGEIFLDDVSGATGTLNSPVATTNDLYIGGPGQNFSGAVLRIVAFNRALTNYEVEKVSKWLSYRYQAKPSYLSDDIESGTILAPIVTGQDYQTHFTANAWTTPNAQIGAGFPIYIQPSNGSAGIYEDKIDFGALLPSSIVSVSWVEQLLDGSVTVVCDISHSTDDVSYTTVTNVTELFIQSFRYVKVKLTMTGADTTSLIEISNINVVVSSKQKTDQGNISVSSTDTSMTATITIASPAVVTAAAHGLVEGQKIRLTTTGALPTGLAIATDYFVRYLTTSTFNLSATPQGALINTTGSQSGTHTVQAGGTWVSFNVTFLDIDSVTGSPQGSSSSVIEVIDFADQPYPTGFNVYLFNSAGTRVSGTFRWIARGV